MQSVCALAVVTALSAFLLREFGWRGVPVLALLCVTLILGDGAAKAGAIGAFLSRIGGAEPISEYAGALFRVTGVGYLGTVTADVCRDLGEGAIARAVGTVSRIEIFLIALPFFGRVIDIGTGLIAG